MRTDIEDRAGIIGHGNVELWDRGVLLYREDFRNLITANGDKVYGERGAGIGSVAAPTGMHLGSASTAVAKTGAGSFITTYISGSNVGFVATYPTSTKPASARRIYYRAAWGPGIAQVANIREIALVNKAIGTNAGATEVETIARVVLGANIDKTSGTATLYVNWYHDLLGA